MNATMPVACHQCGKQYHAPVSLAGKHIRCKACGEVFSIPASDVPASDGLEAFVVDDNDTSLPGTAFGSRSPAPPVGSSQPGRQSPSGGAGYASTAKLTASGGAGGQQFGRSPRPGRSDEIDYEIFGDEAQYG